MSSPILRKLVLAFLVVVLREALILGGLSFYAKRELVNIARQLEEISRSLEATRALNLSLAELSDPINSYLLQADPGAEVHFAVLMQGVQKQLQSCGTAFCHGSSKRPREMVSVISPDITKVKKLADELFSLRDPLRSPEGIDIMTRIVRTTEEVLSQTKIMDGALLKRVGELREQSRLVSRQATNLLFIFTATVVGLAVVTGFFVSQKISKPIRQLSLGTKRIVQGDLSYRVEAGEADEIGELGRSFNAMIAELATYKERVEEYSRSLEEKVRQRTEELKRKEESLRQSEKLASIGLLASGVAHELNNPLTSILMNINLLMEEVSENSPLYRDMRKIDEDASRCKRIIDELREFSRKRELQLEYAQVNDILRKTLDLVGHDLELKEIKTETHLEADLPLVRCDADRLQQVFTNVILNAVQAMGTGGSLRLVTRAAEDQVVITVQDSGPGIPPAARPMGFDPFFTTKEDGTGLGLSISYGIVQEHGGKIEIESVVEEEAQQLGKESGTTLRVTLPVDIGKEESD